MFDVDPWTGTVIVSGRLSWNYATISYFQIQANNTQAPFDVRKTDIGTVLLHIRLEKTVLDRGSRSDRPRYCVTPHTYALDINL